ncbi:MAG: M6 family metalloprotease domain-containing protein [Candidatus Bathyarchaeia archaeon]
MEAGSWLSREYWIRAARRVRHRVFLSAVGRLRAVMLFVDFPNAPASNAPEGYRDTEPYYRWFAPAIDWFKASSYGRLDLEITPIHKWYRMSKADSEYGFKRDVFTRNHHIEYIKEAVSLADNDVDFSQYDIVYIVPSRNALNITYSPTFIGGRHCPIVADGKEIAYVVTFGRDMWRWGFKVLNHETGHILGLPDLYAFKPKMVGSRRDIHYYVGGWDLMGWISGHAPDFFAWSKLKLGWIDENQVDVAFEKGTTEYHLTPIEISGDTKMVIIPSGPYMAYVAESRRPIVNDETAIDSGLLIYKVNIRIRSGRGPIRVIDAIPGEDKMPSRDLDHACFGIGEGRVDTFEDKKSGITVKVIKQDYNEDVIQVTRVLKT